MIEFNIHFFSNEMWIGRDTIFANSKALVMSKARRRAKSDAYNGDKVGMKCTHFSIERTGPRIEVWI